MRSPLNYRTLADSAKEDSSLATGFAAPRRIARAFTLIELMVVMGIIAALLALSILSFNNLLGGRGVEASINSISGLIELSRATAISKRTRVFTVFKNVINSDNSWELKCMGFASLSGLNDYSAANLRPISKMIRIAGVKDVKYSLLPANVQAVTPADLQGDGAFIASYYATETSSKFGSGNPVVYDGEDFQGATFIAFYSDGEVGVSGSQDPYGLMTEPRVAIGLVPTRGPNIQTNAKDGAIIAFYGSSGRMRIVRP